MPISAKLQSFKRKTFGLNKGLTAVVLGLLN